MGKGLGGRVKAVVKAAVFSYVVLNPAQGKGAVY